MDFAVWAYPWDILDDGVETFADRLAEIGVTQVNLATNYHTVQAFLPHNPERRTFFARASSYFHPDERFGELAPVPNETMGDTDWVDEITAGFEATDIDLNSWTVGCHNSRLGLRHPDLTLETPFGDSLAFGLCPSQPAVQEYLTALVEQLAESFSFERIELETFDYFHGSGLGWHHDKFHVRLGTLGEFLWGLCFCDACRAAAADDGVAVDDARTTAKETIDAIIDGELPPDMDVTAWLTAHPHVMDYAAVREETLADLYANLDRAAAATRLGYYVGLLSVGQTWMHGVDLERLGEHVDYYTIVAYESSREEAVDVFNEGTALAPETPLHAGVLPGHPAVHDRATVEEIVDGLVEAGAERISFYNYGLLPERCLDWIGAATESYR